jgi:hypothetical protein
MSISGRQIFAQAANVGLDNDGGTVLLVNYKYSPPFHNNIGVIDGGQVPVPMGGRTESEINASVQAAVLVYCQTETEYTEDFVLSDVTGGRI